ncbi:MAG: hypothetical protein J6W16_00490 [Methanobrevibacter sp.]|nr:hypothetical protein [Methanobrevibacter sp.]
MSNTKAYDLLKAFVVTHLNADDLIIGPVSGQPVVISNNKLARLILKTNDFSSTFNKTMFPNNKFNWKHVLKLCLGNEISCFNVNDYESFIYARVPNTIEELKINLDLMGLNAK